MEECEHDHQQIGSQCFKDDGMTTGLGTTRHDQSVARSMVSCRRCTKTKEIITIDHGPLKIKP